MKTIVYTGLAALALCVTAAFYACSPKESPVQSDFDFAGSQLRIALQTADSIRSAQGKTLAELPSPRNIEPDGSMPVGRPDRLVQRLFPRRTVVHVRIHRRRFLETAGRSLYRSPRKPANEPGYARYRLYDVLQLRQRGASRAERPLQRGAARKRPLARFALQSHHRLHSLVG